MLLSFEGIDGCGKSTQIDLLKDYLNCNNVSFYVFREPGGTEISERIRSLLLHDAKVMDPVTELLLFSAARSQLIREKVVPLLENNQIIILDRFYDSTTAYQGYGRESVDLESIHTLNKIASHSIAPDITFYLKIDPSEAEKRTRNSVKDRMEEAGSSFFTKVSAGYDEISKTEKRFHVIDAAKPPREIHNTIVQIFKTYQ